MSSSLNFGNPFSHIEKRLATRKRRLSSSASTPNLNDNPSSNRRRSKDFPKILGTTPAAGSISGIIPTLNIRPSDTSNLNVHSSIVSFLEPFYQNVTGFCTDHPDASESPLLHNSMTYGEVTWAGMAACYKAMGPVHEEDVFYDLGSGIGKFVVYVALRGRVTRSVGLEVGAKRHETAVEVGDKIRRKMDSLGDSCKVLNPSDFCFEQKDISRANYPTDLSIAFLSNLVMDTQLQTRTLDRLFKCCPKLRMVVAIIPIRHARLKLITAAHVGCTWAKISSWQIYKVLGEELRPTLLKSRLRNI